METEYLIQQALAELMRGRTTFVIAQRLATIRNADLILVLDHGQVVERGTHAELTKTSDFYNELVAAQARQQQELAQRNGPRPPVNGVVGPHASPSSPPPSNSLGRPPSPDGAHRDSRAPGRVAAGPDREVRPR